MTESRSANAHGNSDVVTQAVTMVVKPEHEQEFLDFAASFAKKVHMNEPGTLLYVLTKHSSEPHTYLWIECYRNQEALQAHSETSYIGEAMSKVQDPKWWTKPHETLQLTQVVPK